MSVRVSILFVAALLLAVSCKKEKDPNRLPSVPLLLEPQKGAVTGTDAVTYKWQCTDSEGDDIVYTFYISSDSANWVEISGIKWAGFKLSSKTSDYRNFPYKEGQKYFWKVKAENSFSGSIPEQESGESVSDISYFFTTPPGVSALRDSSGHQFVNLYWKDPENLDHVEITFSPTVSGISQPVNVNAGVGKVELSGFENSTIYSFFVKTYDKFNHASAPDTIKAMPLLPILVHDADFNIYSIVKIGTQTWLRENLRATKWQDGTEMKDKYGNILYKIGSKSDIYGYYYYARTTKGGFLGNKNACPLGYHVPTEAEWITLERYLGMPEEDINNTSYSFIRGEDEAIGNMLKSTTGWDVFNGNSGNGTDLYGLKLLPAGFMEAGQVEHAGNAAYLWTSTGDGYINKARIYSNEYKGVRWSSQGDWTSLSIRCIKD